MKKIPICFIANVKLTWITCCSAVVSKGATLIDRALSLIEIGSVASVGRDSSAVAVSIVPDSDRSWFANGRTTSCDNGISMNDDGAIGASPVHVCRAAAPSHPRPRLSKIFHTLQFIKHTGFYRASIEENT